MAKATGVQLLSALRKTGSYNALIEIPLDYFTDDDEKSAFLWLKKYAREYKKFPSIETFKKETGVTTTKVKEPLAYYISRARMGTLYRGVMPLYSELTEALKDKKPDEAVEHARSIIKLSQSIEVLDKGKVELADAVSEAVKDFEEAQASSGLRGVPSGWHNVDKQTGGWQPGDLITLVGRPGRGKTYVLLHMAYKAWLAGRSVLFVSMEMNSLQVGRRLIGIHTGVNPDYIRKGRLSSRIRNRMLGGIQDLSRGVPFTIIVGSFRKSVSAIEGLIEELSPDLVVVDASYLLKASKKTYASRRESVSDTIEELKMLAVDYHCPILQSVQFNREAVRKGRIKAIDSRRNPLSHLGLHKIGETDVIPQTSSIVMAIELFDPPYEDTRRWMGFLKGREGEQGHWAINYQFNPVNFDRIIIKDDKDIADKKKDKVAKKKILNNRVGGMMI